MSCSCQDGGKEDSIINIYVQQPSIPPMVRYGFWNITMALVIRAINAIFTAHFQRHPPSLSLSNSYSTTCEVRIENGGGIRAEIGANSEFHSFGGIAEMAISVCQRWFREV